MERPDLQHQYGAVQTGLEEGHRRFRRHQRRRQQRPGCSQNRRGGRGANNPLQSPHPGGILVGMCDGSVQFMAGTVDLAILLRLAIRDDGQQVKLDN